MIYSLSFRPGPVLFALCSCPLYSIILSSMLASICFLSLVHPSCGVSSAPLPTFFLCALPFFLFLFCSCVFLLSFCCSYRCSICFFLSPGVSLFWFFSRYSPSHSRLISWSSLSLSLSYFASVLLLTLYHPDILPFAFCLLIAFSF